MATIEDDGGHNGRALRTAILALSEASDWEVARREWALQDVYEADEPQSCPCGKFPIMEICVIRNRVNKNTAEVGNVCVKRFLGIRSDLVFTGLKRVRADNDKALNADAIAYFHEKNVLNDWERDFSGDTLRKRELSPGQMSKRRAINLKVLAAVARRGFRGAD